MNFSPIKASYKLLTNNIKAEIMKPKPQMQSIASAYATQKAALKKFLKR